MDEIKENEWYKTCQAARLVKCDRHTLAKDADEGLIEYTISAKGYRKFRGADLIHYKNFVL